MKELSKDEARREGCETRRPAKILREQYEILERGMKRELKVDEERDSGDIGTPGKTQSE